MLRMLLFTLYCTRAFGPRYGVELLSVPDYPGRTVESNSLRLYWNFMLFCLLYIHINNNNFTCDKFKSAKFGFSILDMF